VAKDAQVFDRFVRVRVSAGFKQKDGTWLNEWFDVVCFDDTKDIVKGVLKGDRLQVNGRLQLGEWETKTGEKRKQWSILASKVEILSKTNAAERPQQEIKNIPF
jgi:single-stranded DNA-binding protein